MRFIISLAVLLLVSVACDSTPKLLENKGGTLKVGAERVEKYFPLIKGKRVALLVNNTSMIGKKKHLVDFLVSSGINVVKIFSPEHGFRGDADAGEKVLNQVDSKTGLPIISLYGKNKKPTAEQLEDVDVVIFDIQDVGVRFYTYISSLHYLMESCAAYSKKIIVLDRPNPNGDYVAGPVLKPLFKSFVGMHEIPVVHGLTVGELAKMINGEGWLKFRKKCDLTVIPVINYDHNSKYSLPIKPSPNLPNDISIRLYPSLCYFEATRVSIGRGTYMPFQVIGYADPSGGEFTFTPVSIPGMSKKPKLMDKKCYGVDLRSEGLNHKFTLKYFLKYYEKSGRHEKYINRKRFFNLLAGNNTLIKKIESGKTLQEIEDSWKDDLLKYKQMRLKYLIYKDFE